MTDDLRNISAHDMAILSNRLADRNLHDMINNAERNGLLYIARNKEVGGTLFDYRQHCFECTQEMAAKCMSDGGCDAVMNDCGCQANLSERADILKRALPYGNMFYIIRFGECGADHGLKDLLEFVAEGIHFIKAPLENQIRDIRRTFRKRFNVPRGLARNLHIIPSYKANLQINPEVWD